MGTALVAVVSARTWLAVIHLLSGLFAGIVLLTVFITGWSTGLGTLPVFPLGIAVLAVTFWLLGVGARVERARFRLLLGVDLKAKPEPRAQKMWHAMWRSFASASSWRHVGYALLRLPVSVVQFVIVLGVWAAGVALLTAPAYDWALPGGGLRAGGTSLGPRGLEHGSFVIRGPGPLVLTAVAGAAVLLAAPWLTAGLAWVDAALGGLLLGPGGTEKLTARIGELETSRAAVLDAAETERRRIERDLHDGAQQRLVSLAMELGRAKAKFASDPDGAAEIVGAAHEQAKEALAELRNLVRGVHPPVLTDRGLDAALSGLAALSPVPVAVQVVLPERPPAGIEAIAYFVVAEALTNVAKHARATRATVTVGRSGDTLRLSVTDNGAGGADPAGAGLSGLAARVAGVDGTMSVRSPAGGPTVVEVRLPCGS